MRSRSASSAPPGLPRRRRKRGGCRRCARRSAPAACWRSGRRTPGALTLHLLASMRATWQTGTSRSVSARMRRRRRAAISSRGETVNTAATASDSFCCFFETGGDLDIHQLLETHLGQLVDCFNPPLQAACLGKRPSRAIVMASEMPTRTIAPRRPVPGERSVIFRRVLWFIFPRNYLELAQHPGSAWAISVPRSIQELRRSPSDCTVADPRVGSSDSQRLE